MEEEEAIKRLNRFKTIKVLYGNTFVMLLEDLEKLQLAIDRVLNLTKDQQSELEKARNTKSLYYENKELRKILITKNKTINLILEEYIFSDGINTRNYCDEQIRKDCCKQDCIKCMKQYFERKVNSNE